MAKNSEKLPKKLPKKLAWLLEQRHGLNQAKLAKAIGVDAAQFGRWLDVSKKSRPTVPQLLDLARYLGVTMEYLADDAVEQPDMPSPQEQALMSLAREVGAENVLFVPDGSNAESHLNAMLKRYCYYLNKFVPEQSWGDVAVAGKEDDMEESLLAEVLHPDRRKNGTAGKSKKRSG